MGGFAAGELVAAVWLQHLGAGIGDLHLHVAPTHRGTWVTPSTLRWLACSMRAAGYTEIEATPAFPAHRAQLLRLGFEPRGADLRLPLYEPQGLP